jgi:rhamnosyltransferase
MEGPFIYWQKGYKIYMGCSLSVIIRTKNESKYLGRVLQRINEQRYAGSVEIIVVDSGSDDHTVSIAKEFGCNVISIKPEEFSFGRSLNIGIENASGELIICLSGHSVPEKTDYFKLMVQPLADHHVAATFGRDIPWPEACPSQARDIFNHFPEVGPDGHKFSNANAALRRDVWERIRFDEEISACEDLLWAKQVMNSEYAIQYIPDAKVFHSHSPSLKYIRKRAYIESKSMNSFLETKHHFGVSRFIEFFLGHIVKDVIFSIRNRYPFSWLFHIPMYRLFQGLGFLKGFREGLHIDLDVLRKIGRYSFEQNHSNNRKKALLVTHCFFPESVGGTEYYTLSLSKSLIAKGWDVIIVSAMRDLTQRRYKVVENKYEGLTVIKINNPPAFYTKSTEHFIDHNIDNIFAKILKAERPSLVHFQHTVYLSTRLPEVVHQHRTPSILTLHDYWYMCYRSLLIRPSEGLCPGPSEGIYCATCYDPAQPNIAGVPRLLILNRMLQMPIIRQLNIKERLSPQVRLRIKKLLYKEQQMKSPGIEEPDAYFPNPELLGILEHSFRLEFIKRQLSFPAVVISPSMHLKQRYEREGFREIMYVPHGFEPQMKIDNLSFNGKLVLAYLSNIVPHKGADVILKELRYIRERKGLKILFYGKVLDAIYQKELEALAKAFSGVDISFMGPYKWKKELGKILVNVHLVVFPSIWEENHPLVVKEALQYGIPVLCSSLGGASEAIKDGVNGFIFDPYKEGDFAERINRILENPQKLEKITEGARNTHVETMEEHVEKIVKIYHDAIGRIFCSSEKSVGN